MIAGMLIEYFYSVSITFADDMSYRGITTSSPIRRSRLTIVSYRMLQVPTATASESMFLHQQLDVRLSGFSSLPMIPPVPH